MVTKHVVRLSITVKNSTFQLSDDGLECDEDGKKTTISYGDIDRFNLISYAGVGGTQGQLSLRTKSGKKLKIRSHHYKSLGSFENRSGTYGPFLRELFERVAQANPDAKFFVGSNAMRLVWLVVFVLSVVIGLFVAYAIISDEIFEINTLGVIAIIVIGGGFSWRNLRNNKQKTFQPNSPPVEFLEL